jgi:small-conductance mechanosensitive channel
MKIIIALIVTVSFFLALKVTRLVLKRLLNRYSELNYIDNLIIAAELIIWMLYIFWATYFLFSKKFYYSFLVYAMIMIIVVFVAWFLLKDVFSGIIFRFKHNLRNDSYVRAGDLSGRIKSQHLTYLKIISDDGQIIRIPYSRIAHEVITEQAYPGALEEHVMHLRVDLSAGNTSASELLVRTVILNAPWSNLKEEPVIKLLKENDDGYFFEVSLLSVNRKHIEFIEMALEKVPSIHVISKDLSEQF